MKTRMTKAQIVMEHDKRVEEYGELAKMLPTMRESQAMRAILATTPNTAAASVVEAYLDRLFRGQ